VEVDLPYWRALLIFMFLSNEFEIFLLIISTITFTIILMWCTELHNFCSFSAVDNLEVNQALMDLSGVGEDMFSLYEFLFVFALHTFTKHQ
jgi:hypothetical protein